MTNTIIRKETGTRIRDTINNILLKTMGITIIIPFPKHSIRLAKQLFKNKKIDVIEIGTYEGENAKYILKNLSINKLYLIDPYEEYSDYNDGTKNVNKAYKKATRRLKNYRDKIIFVKEYASNVKDKMPMVDYIYIDGNHTYDYVLEDCRNYWPKVKDGGILAGHDMVWPTVLNAVQDFCKENNLNFQVSGQDWWIVKNKKDE